MAPNEILQFYTRFIQGIAVLKYKGYTKVRRNEKVEIGEIKKCETLILSCFNDFENNKVM